MRKRTGNKNKNIYYYGTKSQLSDQYFTFPTLKSVTSYLCPFAAY